MPRPPKRRRVCCLPENRLFGPRMSGGIGEDSILMSVEEYETIRLIDLEGLTQEECAESMKVARPTVQRMYRDARRKLADSLVNGSVLRIEGGNYKLCETTPQNKCGHGRCHRHGCRRIEKEKG